jgi:hypothetical protein
MMRVLHAMVTYTFTWVIRSLSSSQDFYNPLTNSTVVYETFLRSPTNHMRALMDHNTPQFSHQDSTTIKDYWTTHSIIELLVWFSE